MSFLAKMRCLLTLGQGVRSGIPEIDDSKDPFDLFDTWFRAASRAGVFLPEAMTLATATADGRPSARIVLLKEATTGGFVFFTNYESRKAGELDANPRAALVVHWSFLERQVRVEGVVERTEEKVSTAYFDSRPRGSRIGAWASRQSRVREDRSALEDRVRELDRKYPGENVPRPPFWGGYRVRPERIEFWQGRADRLHDRLVFRRDAAEGGWKTERLDP